eukprot:TRINITY_DN16492_c0_g1_i2.p1 TRINITY_DN16492_c0_g1~~TRINITY_DN16492_c0_g1_i2.p1  ORF type:complete len:610 (+),score=77.30 TRINITY_DN16492_c0_g1_i2:112-1941(+)
MSSNMLQPAAEWLVISQCALSLLLAWFARGLICRTGTAACSMSSHAAAACLACCQCSRRKKLVDSAYISSVVQDEVDGLRLIYVRGVRTCMMLYSVLTALVWLVILVSGHRLDTASVWHTLLSTIVSVVVCADELEWTPFRMDLFCYAGSSLCLVKAALATRLTDIDSVLIGQMIFGVLLMDCRKALPFFPALGTVRLWVLQDRLNLEDSNQQADITSMHELFGQEFITGLFIYLVVLMHENAWRQKFRRTALDKVTLIELRPVYKLLGAQCDCVVHLDSKRRIKGHTPKLADLLVAGSASLEGVQIDSYIAENDYDRFVNFLEWGSGENAQELNDEDEDHMATALHLNLKDSMGISFAVEVFHAPVADSSFGRSHLLCIRDSGGFRAGQLSEHVRGPSSLNLPVLEEPPSVHAEPPPSTVPSEAGRLQLGQGLPPNMQGADITSIGVSFVVSTAGTSLAQYTVSFAELTEDLIGVDGGPDLTELVDPQELDAMQRWLQTALRRVRNGGQRQVPASLSLRLPFLGRVHAKAAAAEFPLGFQGPTGSPFLLKMSLSGVRLGQDAATAAASRSSRGPLGVAAGVVAGLVGEAAPNVSSPQASGEQQRHVAL